MNHQTAMNLVGHRSAATHARYLRTTKKMTELPEAAVGAFSAALGGGEAAVEPASAVHDAAPRAARAASSGRSGAAPEIRPRAWPYRRSERARPAPQIAPKDRRSTGTSGATAEHGAGSFTPRRRADKKSKATGEGGLTKSGADGTLRRRRTTRSATIPHDPRHWRLLNRRPKVTQVREPWSQKAA